jgi:hypothetical protein
MAATVNNEMMKTNNDIFVLILIPLNMAYLALEFVLFSR